MSLPVVLLAGGLGSRLREETEIRPKPMVTIGDRPILWHIMKIYASHGFNEFVICLGYRGDVIKHYFLDYSRMQGSFSLDLASGVVSRQGHQEALDEAWKLHLLETGDASMTGGRVRRAAQFLGRRRFLLTYGDGVADIDIPGSIAAHEASGKILTVSAVRPPARFGGLQLEGDHVVRFNEKPSLGEGWINGGFMICEPEIADYIEDDATILEHAPMERLAGAGNLGAYRHEGFWQCMDTVRELTLLRSLWDAGAPWKRW